MHNEADDTDGSSQTTSQNSGSSLFTTCSLEGTRDALCNQRHEQEQQQIISQRPIDDVAVAESEPRHNDAVIRETWSPAFEPTWTVERHLHSLRNFKGQDGLECASSIVAAFCSSP